MTVINLRADGVKECFETDRYLISTKEDMHPLIVKVTVYDKGKKIASYKRPFAWWYKNVTFNSTKVQEELRKINEKEIKPAEV